MHRSQMHGNEKMKINHHWKAKDVKATKGCNEGEDGSVKLDSRRGGRVRDEHYNVWII
jgi:hypothetical protein